MKDLKNSIKIAVIVSVVCVVCLLLLDFLFDNTQKEHTHINPDPVVVGTYKLDTIPTCAFYCDGIYFLSSNNVLNKVQIKNNNIVYNEVAKNVLKVFYSSDHFVIQFIDGKIKIMNSSNNYEYVNKKFAEAVFEYSKESPVLQIVPSETFDNTMVLFEDGTLFSTFNYMQLSEVDQKEQFDFKVFEDINVVDIASGHDDYIFDSNGDIHTFLHDDNFKWSDGTLIDHSKYFSINNNGSIFMMAWNYYEKHDDSFKEPIVRLESGFKDATLALSNSNKLYHFGYSYLNETECMCLPSVYPPEVVYNSDKIKHFFTSNYGIVVILKDGTMEIIKN